MQCFTKIKLSIAIAAYHPVFAVTAVPSSTAQTFGGVVFEYVVAMIVAVWIGAVLEWQADFEEIAGEWRNRPVGLERK